MSEFDFEELPENHQMGANNPPDEIEDIDFEADAQIAVSEDQLATVSRLSNEYTELKTEIDRLEGLLEQAKARFDQIRWYELPDAMAAANMDMIQSNGVKISVGSFVRASLMKDEESRKKAADWLRENHRGAIIKRSVGVVLGVGNDEAASAAMEALREALPDAVVTDAIDVHHSTLSATLKEMMADGDAIPTVGAEIGMNLHVGKEAKISKAKR